jgi:hypothetical protein
MLHDYVTVMSRYNHWHCFCTDTDSKDVACAGRNYVAIMSPALLGLEHL